MNKNVSVNLDSTIDPYFYSLVGCLQNKVARKCLRCRKEFNSHHLGNRCCSSCSARNSRESSKADLIFEIPY